MHIELQIDSGDSFEAAKSNAVKIAALLSTEVRFTFAGRRYKALPSGDVISLAR